jgi:drug/metabolite transporter (DMT)-like permease
VTALFYGAFLLDEPITAQAIAGLVLILTGTALGSGLLRMPRRGAAVATSPP